MSVICPNCRGKGHVFNALMLMCPFFWPLALFDTRNKDGFTREDCSHCDGTGYIQAKARRP